MAQPQSQLPIRKQKANNRVKEIKNATDSLNIKPFSFYLL